MASDDHSDYIKRVVDAAHRSHPSSVFASENCCGPWQLSRARTTRASRALLGADESARLNGRLPDYYDSIVTRQADLEVLGDGR